jgi:hypothetical protein
MEGCDEANEGSVELAVGKVRTGAHAGASTVGVMRCSRALGVFDYVG